MFGNISKVKSIPKKFWQNRKWYVKRFNWYPFTLFPQVISVFFHKGIKTPFAFKWAGTFCFESAEWYWDNNDLIRIRTGILKKGEKSKKYSDWFVGEFFSHFKKLERVLTITEKIDFTEISDREVARVLKNLIDAETGVAAWGYLADSFLTSGEDNWLIEEIRKEIKDQKIIDILTAPGFESFVNKEKISLLKSGTYKKDRTKFTQALRKHRDNYYWIQNGYWMSHNLKEEFFSKEIQKLSRQGIDFWKEYNKESTRVKDNLKSKQKIYQKFNISKRLQNIIYCSDKIGLMHDTRKQAALRLNHFLFLIAEEIAKRVKITKTEALSLVHPEVEEVLLHHKINRKELKSRWDKCFIYLSPQGYKILSGKEAKKINLNIFHEQEDKLKVLKGTLAFMGFARGYVRVVNNHKDMLKFKKGEILVTNNTTPEFVPLMKKAKAIVTEQGGMTTHAAIVSRELKVPCIVGVSGITRVLKTRDLVEVDSNKGIVRKI